MLSSVGPAVLASSLSTELARPLAPLIPSYLAAHASLATQTVRPAPEQVSTNVSHARHLALHSHPANAFLYAPDLNF